MGVVEFKPEEQKHGTFLLSVLETKWLEGNHWSPEIYENLHRYTLEKQNCNIVWAVLVTDMDSFSSLVAKHINFLTAIFTKINWLGDQLCALQ